MKRRPARSSEKVVRIRRTVATVGEALKPEPHVACESMGQPVCGGRNDKKSNGWFLLQLTSDGTERVPVLWTETAPSLFHRIMQRVFFGYRWQKL